MSKSLIWRILNSGFILSSLLYSTGSYAQETYEPHKSYVSGSVVVHKGEKFRAKWWANPGQSPANIATQPWDTPWESLGPGSGQTENDAANSQNQTGEMQEKQETSNQTVSDDSNIPLYESFYLYKGGDLVRNHDKIYVCNTGITEAWCSGAAWAYEPGVGTAWQQAWSPVGEDSLESEDQVETVQADPEQPTNSEKTDDAYDEGTEITVYDPNRTYVGGDVVKNLDQYYVCNKGVTATWCSGAAWAYEPGFGTAWEQAWSLTTEKAASATQSTDEATSEELDNPVIEPS